MQTSKHGACSSMVQAMIAMVPQTHSETQRNKFFSHASTHTNKYNFDHQTVFKWNWNWKQNSMVIHWRDFFICLSTQNACPPPPSQQEIRLHIINCVLNSPGNEYFELAIIVNISHSHAVVPLHRVGATREDIIHRYEPRSRRRWCRVSIPVRVPAVVILGAVVVGVVVRLVEVVLSPPPSRLGCHGNAGWGQKGWFDEEDREEPCHTAEWWAEKFSQHDWGGMLELKDNTIHIILV